MKLVLAFSDIKHDRYNTHHILYGHKIQVPCDAKSVDIHTAKIDEKYISAQYDAFVNQYMSENHPALEKNITAGCLNNFYTNLLVVYKWVSSIKQIISKHSTQEIIITDFIKNIGFVPYYEAEGESHFPLLYKPYDFIPSLIIAFLEKEYPNISVRIQTKHPATFLRIRVFLRRYALFFFKATIMLLISFYPKQSKGLKKNLKTANKLIFTRSVAHQLSMSLFEKIDAKSVVFCGEGLFTFRDNYKYAESRVNFPISYLSFVTPFLIFKVFLNITNIIINRKKGVYINVQHVPLHFSNAFVELSISYFEVLIHEYALERFLKKCKAFNCRLIINTEMYSPYTKSVSNLAKKLSIKNIQVQSTNMFTCHEPNFIHSNLFLFNTYALVKSFLEKYPERKDKVPFWGNVTCRKPEDITIESLKNPLKNVIYFTQPKTDEDIEQDIIQKLINLSDVFHFKLYIKLHPRDRISKLKRFKPNIQIISRHENFEDYIKNMDVAFLKTSSIAFNILLAGTPVVYCLFSAWGRTSKLDYIDPNYKGSIYNLSEIKNTLEKFKSLQQDFVSYRDRYIVHNCLKKDVLFFIQKTNQFINS